jgi:hypothetical protein
MAGSCEYGDEPAGSGATELVMVHIPTWTLLILVPYRRVARPFAKMKNRHQIFTPYFLRTHDNNRILQSMSWSTILYPHLDAFAVVLLAFLVLHSTCTVHLISSSHIFSAKS